MQSGWSSLPFVHIFHVGLTRQRPVHRGKHSSIPCPVFLPTLQFHFPVASPVQKCQIENSSHIQHKNSKLFFIIFYTDYYYYLTVHNCYVRPYDGYAHAGQEYAQALALSTVSDDHWENRCHPCGPGRNAVAVPGLREGAKRWPMEIIHYLLYA